MNFKFNYYWLLLIFPLIFICWFFISQKNDRPIRHLAYFGPKQALKVNDTTYHFIPPFEFKNQYNEPVSNNTVKNKIYVAEYFFTTCRSICPVMNTHLQRVYKEFKNDPDVLILSHTVDPETDSVNVLLEYARAHGVTDKKWLFLTGEKKQLYDLARKGYLLNAEEGNGGAEDFIHTQNFALIDSKGHIRGFYDGTDSAEVHKLVSEIHLLKKEHAYEEISNH